MVNLTMKEIAALCGVPYNDVVAAARMARGGKRQYGKSERYDIEAIRPHLDEIISDRIARTQARLEALQAMKWAIEQAGKGGKGTVP